MLIAFTSLLHLWDVGIQSDNYYNKYLYLLEYHGNPAGSVSKEYRRELVGKL
jgi:hypothetical protein